MNSELISLVNCALSPGTVGDMESPGLDGISWIGYCGENFICAAFSPLVFHQVLSRTLGHGERIVFSTDFAGTTRHPHGKE